MGRQPSLTYSSLFCQAFYRHLKNADACMQGYDLKSLGFFYLEAIGVDGVGINFMDGALDCCLY